MMAVKTRKRLSWFVVGFTAVMAIVLASLLGGDTAAAPTTQITQVESE